MIFINTEISLNENEIIETFIHASGPGGQNINKTATAVQLRFDAENSLSLPDHVRERLKQTAGKKITNRGIVIIEAKRFRTQKKNREDALNRLIKIIREAAKKPKPRRKTKPSKAANERRLKIKHLRSNIKKLRKHVKNSNDI